MDLVVIPAPPSPPPAQRFLERGDDAAAGFERAGLDVALLGDGGETAPDQRRGGLDQVAGQARLMSFANGRL